MPKPRKSRIPWHPTIEQYRLAALKGQESLEYTEAVVMVKRIIPFVGDRTSRQLRGIIAKILRGRHPLDFKQQIVNALKELGKSASLEHRFREGKPILSTLAGSESPCPLLGARKPYFLDILSWGLREGRRENRLQVAYLYRLEQLRSLHFDSIRKGFTPEFKQLCVANMEHLIGHAVPKYRNTLEKSGIVGEAADKAIKRFKWREKQKYWNAFEALEDYFRNAERAD